MRPLNKNKSKETNSKELKSKELKSKELKSNETKMKGTKLRENSKRKIVRRSKKVMPNELSHLKKTNKKSIKEYLSLSKKGIRMKKPRKNLTKLNKNSQNINLTKKKQNEDLDGINKKIKIKNKKA